MSTGGEVSASEADRDPQRWLLHAIWSSDSELVLTTLKLKPELLTARLSGNVTPLLAAAYAKRIDLAESIVAMGARMDYISAIALNRLDLVEAMLLDNPGLIRRQAPDLIGSLHVAAHFADERMVSCLLAHGADVNDSRNPKKLTPIFFAWRDPYRNAEILLDSGADVNARSKHGFTPLHRASKAGRLAFVRLLLGRGASVSAQTDGRQTAWSLAVRFGHRDMAALLSSA